MRRSPHSIMLTALILAAMTAPVGAQDRTPPSRTITVTAMGEVQAVPDRADVQLGVETRASTAQAAMAQNNAQMAQVVAALRQLGIPETNIQTSILNLRPVYSQPSRENPNQPPQLTGFEATNIVQVRLTDLTQVGAVIDAALTAGANRVQGIGFRVVDEDQVRLSALRDAAARARPKAEALAASFGLTLGPVDAIAETSAAVIPFMTAPVAEGRGDTTVLPGTVPVRVEIQVRYNIQ